MKAGGDRRPLTPLLSHFGETPLARINQTAIDSAALTLFPDVTPATRNREVYTLVSAILKHAGQEFEVRRPKGSRGRVITKWLWPEQAFRIFAAARSIDPEFAILLEQLLSESFVFLGNTKNGEARPVHLPPFAVASLANHPRGLDRKGLLETACRIACGLPRPARVKFGNRELRPVYELDWVNFHTFCHTWATWMRRYAGLDDKGLVATGRWKDIASASRYCHTVVSEESRRADRLPTPMEKLGK
jgi:hypothetical protein